MRKTAQLIRSYLKLAEEAKGPVDPSQVLKATREVEVEHARTVGYNKATEAGIAADHLQEDPDYYKKLKKYVEPDKN
jgi:hypothetical protein